MNSIRVIAFSVVALAFPIGALVVAANPSLRFVVANALSLLYGFGLPIGIYASFLPLRSLQGWTRLQRMESAVLSYLSLSYVTHLTWELGWLACHPWIIANRDSPLAFAWWAYIDGGDSRYAAPTTLLLVMETLSVCNGLVGSFALWRFLRSKRRSHSAILMLSATAVVHLYSALVYYATEIVDDFPSVQHTFLSLYVKFFLANSPWVVTPPLVLWWASLRLESTSKVD